MSDFERLDLVLSRSGDPDNPSAERLHEILHDTHSVAVVGMSRDPAKAARRVPSYMAAKGYDIIPVNPHAERILGRPVMPRLLDIERALDMVLVFRPSAEAAGVLREAAARPERPVIWLQEDIRADDEAREARDSGLTVIQDLCFFQAHRALSEDEARSVTPP